MRVRRLGLLAVGVALWSAPAPAPAQTLFDWPDTTVNIEAYATLEECQAAVARSLIYTDSRRDLTTGIWTDTIPLDSLDAAGPRPLPTPVVETARRCGARFSNADTVSVANFDALFTLYLQAGWDAKAHTLVKRRLAAVGVKDDRERASVLGSAFRVLLALSNERVGQRRTAMAEDILKTGLPQVSDRLMRLVLYQQLSLIASFETNADSAAAKAQRVVAGMRPIMDSLTKQEMDKLRDGGPFTAGIEDQGDYVQRYYAMLNMSLGKRTFLDSLRHSTAAYVKLKRDNWARATGMLPETYRNGDPLGEQAPPITADLWLGYDPSNGPRPTPGHVSLVVFLNNHECNGVPTTSIQLGRDCARSLDPLRRLEERFPELEVTVVSPASGHFLYLKDGMTPEREAELTKQWLESHGVHAALAMTTTGSWRLPDPDSRQISRPTGNRTNYSFGSGRRIANSSAFLIDQDGIVVHTRQMNRWSVYQDYDELIEILLHRQTSEATQ
jgi:hypothetical protein